MLVIAVNLVKAFLKATILLIRKRQQAPVILITHARVMQTTGIFPQIYQIK